LKIKIVQREPVTCTACRADRFVEDLRQQRHQFSKSSAIVLCHSPSPFLIASALPAVLLVTPNSRGTGRGSSQRRLLMYVAGCGIQRPLSSSHVGCWHCHANASSIRSSGGWCFSHASHASCRCVGFG